MKMMMFPGCASLKAMVNWVDSWYRCTEIDVFSSFCVFVDSKSLGKAALNFIHVAEDSSEKMVTTEIIPSICSSMTR